MSVKLAFVGAGYMAHEHAKAFAASEGVEIVGVTGGRSAKASEFGAAFGCRAFASIAEMYAATEADAVVVAVPELACKNVCEHVFAFPWRALLEKPVGLDLAEAEHLLGLSQAAGRTDYVALNRRSYGVTRQARAMLDEAPAPRLIQVHDTQDLVAAREFGQPEAVIDNYMFANSVHLVDYLAVFGRGDIVDIRVPLVYDAAAPHSIAASVLFSSGDRAVYVGGWNLPGPWYVTVATADLRIELRPLEQLGFQRRGERKLTILDPDQDDVDFKPGLKYQAEQFLAAVRGGEADLATLADATATMRLVAGIYGRS